MSLLGTSVAVALDAVAVALLGSTTWLAFRSRDRPSAPPFIAILALLTLLGVFSVLAELPGTSAVPLLSAIVDFGQFGVGIVLPGVWVVYALSYTGRGTGLTRLRVAMFLGMALPIALSAAVIAAPLSRSVIEAVLASLLGTEIMFLFVLFAYGTYLLIGHGWSHARISKLQLAIVISAVAAPYFFGGEGSSDPIADGVTVGLLVSSGLFAVAIRRYPVMTGFPKADYVARTRVVEALREAVVVLDWEGNVLDANATTGELFDRSPASMVGDSIHSIVDGLEEMDLSAGAAGTVTLQTTKGRRRFQFSVSGVGDADAGAGADASDDPVARTVLLRDVTDRQTREQRLSVLNRVLRHNVRNELDVVLAYADRIDDNVVREGIRESATDLVELSDKAREAEDVMTASAGSPESVDLVAVAQDVVEEYRTGDAEIALTRPDELVVSSHRSVVRQVLSELVDNAIEHGDRPSPGVEVTVRSGPDGAAELVVADDGPGIPDRERRILDAGTETQLEHGRGIGLWFVSWAVTQLGGELSFRENDPSGSVVTVRLYGSEYDA